MIRLEATDTQGMRGVDAQRSPGWLSANGTPSAAPTQAPLRRTDTFVGRSFTRRHEGLSKGRMREDTDTSYTHQVHVSRGRKNAVIGPAEIDTFCGFQRVEKQRRGRRTEERVGACTESKGQ